MIMNENVQHVSIHLSDTLVAYKTTEMCSVVPLKPWLLQLIYIEMYWLPKVQG